MLGWAAVACGVAGLAVGVAAMADPPGDNGHPFWSMALLRAGAVALAFAVLRRFRDGQGRPWAAVAGLTAGVICLIISIIGLAVFAVFGAVADFFS